jgi:hypothetical protein
VKNRKEVFYELPEKGLKMEKYQDEKKQLEYLWDGLRFNLKNETVMNIEEITNRADELNMKINKLETLGKETSKMGSDQEYQKKLQKRKNLVNYIAYLKDNRGVDADNMDPKDLMEPRSNNIDQLLVNQRFWRNVGQNYNKNFDMGMDWKTKVQKLEIEIEETNRMLDDIEEREQEEAREREMKRQRQMVEEREREYEYMHQQDESRYTDGNNDINLSSPQYGQEEFEWRENEERIKTETLEKENQELEQNIRQLEDQKREIEVRVTRGN